MSKIIQTLQKQLQNAANTNKNIKPVTYEIMKNPQKILTFHIPFQKDDGTNEIIHGFRVQHNNSLGPYKGGIRYVPHLHVDDTTTLAKWMTIKCALQEALP